MFLTTLTLLTEAHTHSHGDSVWEDYVSIITDPGHFLAELTFTVLDIIVLTPLFLLAWTFIKKWIVKALHKEHLRLDREHGIVHADKETRGAVPENAAEKLFKENDEKS